MSSNFDFAVINLKERTDRWEKIEENFKEFKILRIDAVKTDEGKIGCFKSHQKALQFAKDNNMEKIFVLEDDCIPCENFKERFKTIKQYLDNNNNWDLYLGGGIIKPPWDRYPTWKNNFKQYINYKSEDFVKISKSYGTFFICYKSTVYDYFLNINRYRNPIDKVWHMGYKMPKLNALISYPFIGTHDAGWSNISNSAISTEGKVKTSEKLLHDYINKEKLLLQKDK